ncbi:hypothetical protein GCM10007036_14750 [Alsobacter metallidurans]|uniref:Copper chaperone PCu(A)C n=1 Tax=Alsobacter metallidurans TaxID=340221 RepID=A0A917MH41_9HYPH|nr:copper chaperone PCu(A)C [Alsobacter metallidurans]GGH15035.1 hypothetical protein GCM10007036_14750 [Alsobacter metallidurans]
MRCITQVFILLSGIIPTALAAEAHDYRLETLAIEHPWARARTSGSNLEGPRMSITNTGVSGDRLLEVRSPAGRVSILERDTIAYAEALLHETASGVEIPAGTTVSLGPGKRWSLAWAGRAPQLRAGKKVRLTLVFVLAGTVKIEAFIEPIEDASRRWAKLRPLSLVLQQSARL